MLVDKIWYFINGNYVDKHTFYKMLLSECISFLQFSYCMNELLCYQQVNLNGILFKMKLFYRL